MSSLILIATSTRSFYKIKTYINIFFAYCKGDNFRRSFAILSAKQGKSGSIYNLGRANVRAFHENPNQIHTELTFINP